MKIKLRFITAFCSLTQTESSNEMDMLAMRHCISSKFSLYATVRQIHLLATDTYMYFRLRFDSWSTYFFLFYYDTFHLQRFRHYWTITLCNYAKSPFYFHGVFHCWTPHGNKRDSLTKGIKLKGPGLKPSCGHSSYCIYSPWILLSF